MLEKPDGTSTNPGHDTLEYLKQSHFTSIMPPSRWNTRTQKSVQQEIPCNKLEELLFIYKSLIMLQFTPSQWTKSKIIWIPKPGKDTYKVFKSWRPISLLNQPLKVMEKLIAKQADKTMTEVHDRQHGFRKNKSTESAISETANYIEKHMVNKEDVIGVFLDIQAAFDTITPSSIKEALLKHNLDKRLVGWYHTFLTHRHLITEHNGVTYEGNHKELDSGI